MLAVLSDTHRETDHGLEGPARDAVEGADRVVHAGDFTTAATLDSFRTVARRLDAVHGNVDEPAVREQLPATRTLEYAGVRIAVAHRRDGGETGLATFGRSRDAALVISGHSHRPGVVDAGDVTLLNPGSHAQPRGYRAAYATLHPADDGLDGRLLGTDGETFERFTVDG